jgi:uncharacterized protein
MLKFGYDTTGNPDAFRRDSLLTLTQRAVNNMEKILNIGLRIGAYIAVGYALLVLVIFVLQRRLIYHPDKERPTEAYLAEIGLRYWPQAYGYQGLVGTGTPRTVIGTVIVFHGNAGSAWQRDYFVKALEPMGYRVILAEYPGYGGRDGEMTETHILADAVEAIAAARRNFGGPIYLIGESMGCGVAAAAASETTPTIDGLLLITPWDSLVAVAQSHYWYVPASLLVKDRYDSIAHLQGFDRPVGVVMAEKDKVIPNKHTEALYEALTAPKRLWRFKNAGHSDWPNQPSAPWWQEAMHFMTTGHLPRDSEMNPNTDESTRFD